jgi:SAM-dependent methyltransferase
MTSQVSLVDFYRRHGISPVRQDISDLEAHFTRRAALYRHIGLLPLFVRGKRVLEIGPGSGFNSLYTATLRPSQYVLLEGNPAGVADIERLFSDFAELREGLEIVTALVDDYTPAERFDFVLCEGVLGLAGVPDPTVMLKRVANFTSPGGVLVITCIDALTNFPEALRRMFAQLIIEPGMPLSEQVERLMPVFTPHLLTLPGMSRRHDDWIIDNLLNPASIGPVLSIPDAIHAIDAEFEFFASSPHYCVDWRWYKAIVPGSEPFNDVAVDQYWRNAHNLFDYRELHAPRDPALNRALYRACDEARLLIREYELTHDTAIVTAFAARLREIATLTRTFSAKTAGAFDEAAGLLADLPVRPEAVASAAQLGAWFARGQQYISFSRNA